jgi:hypothetical protein
MAMYHGKGLAFKIDNAAGTLQTLTAYVDGVDLDNSVDMGETTTANIEDKTFVSGQAEHGLSISGKWDDTATTGPDAILFGLVGNETSSTFEFGPGGLTAGKVKYTGECFLTGYKKSAPVGGVVTFTADFKITGAVTRTVWP